MVGMSYQATSYGTIDAEFQCARCGHHARASVLGEGIGVAKSPLFLFGQTARDIAARDSVQGISQDARRSLDLVACPSCSRRGRGLLRMRLTGALVGLIIAVPAFLFSLLITMLVEPHPPAPAESSMEPPLVVGSLVALASALIAFRLFSAKRIRWADNAVTFLSPPA